MSNFWSKSLLTAAAIAVVTPSAASAETTPQTFPPFSVASRGAQADRAAVAISANEHVVLAFRDRQRGIVVRRGRAAGIMRAIDVIAATGQRMAPFAAATKSLDAVAWTAVDYKRGKAYLRARVARHDRAFGATQQLVTGDRSAPGFVDLLASGDRLVAIWRLPTWVTQYAISDRKGVFAKPRTLTASGSATVFARRRRDGSVEARWLSDDHMTYSVATLGVRASTFGAPATVAVDYLPITSWETKDPVGDGTAATSFSAWSDGLSVFAASRGPDGTLGAPVRVSKPGVTAHSPQGVGMIDASVLVWQARGGLQYSLAGGETDGTFGTPRTLAKSVEDSSLQLASSAYWTIAAWTARGQVRFSAMVLR